MREILSTQHLFRGGLWAAAMVGVVASRLILLGTNIIFRMVQDQESQPEYCGAKPGLVQ